MREMITLRPSTDSWTVTFDLLHSLSCECCGVHRLVDGCLLQMLIQSFVCMSSLISDLLFLSLSELLRHEAEMLNICHF